MGAGGFVSQTFLQLAQNEGEGVIALEPGLAVAQMPGGKAFEDAYKTRFKSNIELHAPFAYDGVGVLIAAIEQANSTDPQKYLPVLRAISYPGVTGTLAFDAQGNLQNPSFTVYQVKANQWQPVSVAGGKK